MNTSTCCQQKSDADNMSICSLLIYWKKILGLPRIFSFLF